MKSWTRCMAVSILAVLCTTYTHTAAAQSVPETVRPGAPGEPTRTVAPAPPPAPPGHTEADVRFMQGMIPHHAQALDMTALVPARSTRRDIHLLAERIEVAQADEIAWMRQWLQDHGADVPDAGVQHHAHGDGHHALMPGMLTPEQMTQLASASGPAFDRLFLQLMIQHHAGALVMVTELLKSPGAAQAPEVYRFASDIEADQRAEIKRMYGMLDAPHGPAPHHPAPDHH